MNTYLRKQQWKTALFVSAVVIALASLWYTNNLVQQLAREERLKVEIWADATREIQNAQLDDDISLIVYKIIRENKTIPVIWTADDGHIITHQNLDSAKSREEDYVQQKLNDMRSGNDAIEIQLPDGTQQYIYYSDSTLLNQIIYYPVVQFFIVCLFVILAYLAFSSSRRAEQNQVWVGMSKETAHQLGTPISSLVAWVEMLKMRNEDQTMILEVEKDVKRLETITERFSKIGSTPVLTPTNIVETLVNAVDYLKKRAPNKVKFYQNFMSTEQITVPINVALFEWVIENLCRNAIDAMQGTGSIIVSLTDQHDTVCIDVTDSGKGIPKSKFKTIFQPGYTTKKRGWGLGLSLAQRIIESYHQGKIFVKSSEIGKGTTFRIILPKS